MRGGIRGLLIGIGVVTVAACGTTSTQARSSTAAPGSSGPAASGPAVVPAGLEKFYDQHLAWGSCYNGYTSVSDAQYLAVNGLECAELAVPLDYAAPAGPAVQVAVDRKKATDPGQRIGSAVIDPGGPGVSGLVYAASLLFEAFLNPTAATSAPTVALNRRFDVVGLDPRGVGASKPAITCQSDTEKDSFRTDDVRTRTAADVAADNARTKQVIDACVRNTGAVRGVDGKTFLANVGTRDVARDLDVLRVALGDQKLTYIGFSYGTEIGWEYAEQFPTHVRALLFDGDIAPNQDFTAAGVNEWQGFQAAFGDFATWCSTQAQCPLGPAPAKALAVYQALVRPLLTAPLPVFGGRRMSFTDAVSGTIFALYSTQSRPDLLAALQGLAAKSSDGLMRLADLYFERDSDGHYSNDSDAFNVIRCLDKSHITDPATATAIFRQFDQAAPFQATGDPAGAVLDYCALLPVPPTLIPHVLHVTGLPQTLVVSATGDPATPYTNGVELANEIGARLLTVKAIRHGSTFGQGDTCADNAALAYLIDLTLPAEGTTCGA